MREIAVRGFINEKFNTTFGKGLFRRAVYNGSVELRNPNSKYLVDYYQYPEWEALAKRDDQLTIINRLADSGITEQDELLYSWLMHYDPFSKAKTPVSGYSIYSQDTCELFIQINDPDNQTMEDWTLDVRACKTIAANKPVFIATNTNQL